MDIGGQDLIFRTPSGINVFHAAINAVFLVWPEYVVETDHDTIPGQSCCFIYMNAEAQADWARDGSNPKWDNAMINILWSDNELTAVVGTNKSDIVYPQVLKIIDNLSKVFERDYDV